MDKQLIKEVVTTRGWNEAKAVLRDEFSRIEVDTNKSCLEIGKRYLAKQQALKYLEIVLNNMDKIKDDEVKKNIKYI